MSLADHLKSPKPKGSGLPCSVGHLLETLEGDELEALKMMLGTPEHRGWSQRRIFLALLAEGHEVGTQTINRHRGGECRCAKDAR